MSPSVERFIWRLREASSGAALGDGGIVEIAAWTGEWSDAEIGELLEALAELAPLSEPQEQLAGAVISLLIRRQQAAFPAGQPGSLPEGQTDRIVSLYRRLGSASKVRHGLLHWLSAVRGQRELSELAPLLANDPPEEAGGVIEALAPLFQNKDYDPALLFPALLDGLAHLNAAAAILDLANFTVREGLVDEHPARFRGSQLAALLGDFVGRLELLEEQPPAQSPEKLSEQVSESVSVAVSICDALALIGDAAAAGKLHAAMRLKHRRLRTEAAAALAALGDEAGQRALLELAAEPVARLRVLQYAEELGILDTVDPRLRQPAARAEAELALYLAQPTQIGLPPTSLELIDERTQYWPGYDDPVECYLFRFAYDFGDRGYSNIGIAGPLAHAFTADLADLGCEDIYAAFAGWQAEHEEIYEIDAQRLTEGQRVEVSRLERRLRDERYYDIRPQVLGFFFGQRVLVVAAKSDGAEGVALNDGVESYWYPAANLSRPLGPREAYCIYKGRKLLRTFNE